MVGYSPQLTLDQSSIPKLSKDAPDPPPDFKPVDLSFVDSLLDFDSIDNWLMDIPNPDSAEKESTVIVAGSAPIGSVRSEIPESLGLSIEEEMGKVSLIGGHEESLVLDGVVSEVASGNVKLEPKIQVDQESKMVSESGSQSSESESESSSASSESSSSSSSDDDDDEDDVDVVEVEKESDEGGELEEGEIRDADQKGNASCGGGDDDDEEQEEEEAEFGWSDTEIFDDGDEEEEVIKGPIRSKNELEVLPPVPPVNVTLEPHHQMLPVGVILSIVDTKVIVEGVEKHNPLNEASILWITKSRSPLGLIDEIFGPVVQPYYMVRYNSESEIPAGIEVGTPISFVQEFADHVLNNRDLYRKGYDASGANDEEVSDEGEFSDDEKEAEYKRMQKMNKRGMNDQNAGNKKNNRKKGKNKMGPWKDGQPSPQQTPRDAGQLPPNQYNQHFSSAAPVRDHGYGPSSSAVSDSSVSGSGSVPPFPGSDQATSMNASSNGGWTNGMPCQPQQTPFPNGFPNNSLPFFPQYPHQMSMPNNMPFLQQSNTGQGIHPGAVLPGQQLNVFGGPMASQGMMAQQGFPQPFGIGFQAQPAPGQPFNSFSGPMYLQAPAGQHGFNQNTFGIGQPGQRGFNPNAFGIGQPGQLGFNPNTFAMGQQSQHGFNQPTNPSLNAEQNSNMPQPVAKDDAPQQFNQSSGNRGRKPYHRGGRQFRGGRERGSR